MPPSSSDKQSEVLTNETKDFLSSLTKTEAWGNLDYLYQYQGFWQIPIQLQGVIRCQKQFKAQDSDMFLVTTPKSGTTWLKALAFATVNRVHYNSPNNRSNTHLQHPLLVTNPHELVKFLDREYIDGPHPDLSSYGSPRLFSTHVPYVLLPESITDDSSKCKVVYLCRNPKDTLVSFWHFINKKRQVQNLGPLSIEEVVDKFSRGISYFGPFWDHVLGYWKVSLENPEKVCFLQFEDMKKEPKLQLRKLAEFLGYPFSLEEEKEGIVEEILRLCSFENMSNLEVNKVGKLSSGLEYSSFFRRGEVGDYGNHLTPNMIELIDQITEEKLQGSGLRFH